MGPLAGVEGRGTPISDPVVYQLVRVEGDGSMIPAMDDEVIEVEHLLERDTKETFTVQYLSHNKGCVSDEVLSSKNNIEGLKALSQSEDAEIHSQKSNARLEYIEQMLQKVKHEERLQLSHESLHSFPGYIDIDVTASDHPNKLAGCEALKSETVSVEAVPGLRNLHGGHDAQSESTETCLEPTTEPSLHIELSASEKPGIPISKGNIPLDNLTVTELQEVFRMTFGRQTTVKDKLWLKRRLARGLRNSYDLPITNATFSDKSASHNIETEQSLSWVQESKYEAGSLSTSHGIEVKVDISLEASSRLAAKSKDDYAFLSGKKLRRSVEECVAKDDNLLIDQIALKRVRKPTRRYIEELPEIESRECTGTLSCSDKNSGRTLPTPVPQIRPIHNIRSQNKTFVTRQDFIGGVRIQIPYASRVRRGCPRKNFMALMVCLASRTTKNFWYLDSGCFRHMIGDVILIKSLEKIECDGKVTFGDNCKNIIKGK